MDRRKRAVPSGNVSECWRRDSNPHGACAPPDFRTTIAFATLAVCGLDFLLAVAVRRRPQPQSLYTFFAGLCDGTDCPSVLRWDGLPIRPTVGRMGNPSSIGTAERVGGRQ